MAASRYRDRFGIPHLRADSVGELARLQGWVTAQDRAWQLDWNRRRAEGRTAEIVGSPGLIFDRFARTARIDDTAQRSYHRLDDETRAWIDSYVAGVNDGLASGAAGGHEFTALDAEPGRFQPWTPLSIFAVIHLLFGGFADKLWRRHLQQRLGTEFFDLLAPEAADSPGSNAWAVNGERTVSGSPMIAGDPHRTADYPGVYQQVRLACDEFDVFGFTFPGVPGIQHFGHAGDVAWAITNAVANYQDLYVEQLSRDGDRVTARGPQGPEEVHRRVESITVRDAEPEPVEILETARGPVIINQPGAGFSLRTPSRTEADLGFGALLPLLRARSVDDVEAALRRWVEPVNSAVVADRTGRVRHLVPGRVPLRDPANQDLPVPAWEQKFGWTGDYATMPVSEDRDLVANGNDRASGGGLGKYYIQPWRADQIRELLTEGGELSADRMATIHRDCRSASALRAQRLLAAVEVDGPAQSIKVEILDWDARMETDSRPALLFAAWRTALIGWLAEQPMLLKLRDPDPLPEVFATAMDVPKRLADAFDSICANADRFEIDLAAGAARALEVVAADPPEGTWGDAHRFVPVHGLAGLADASVPELPHPPLAGDVHCVRAMASTPGVTDLCSYGSMNRYVWDLADPSGSRWVVPFGASGRSGDPHAVDQTDIWAAGELLPVITDWQQLIKEG